MDRRTIRYPDGAVELKCSVNDAVMCLADYEDTGMEPEELTTVRALCEDYVSAGLDAGFIRACINAVQSGMSTERITEITKAESEGRLIVLPPCGCGDTLYYILDGKIYKGTVYHIQYDDYHGTISSTVSASLHGGYSSVAAEFDAIGKTVFLTREEAEAALGGNHDA